MTIRRLFITDTKLWNDYQGYEKTFEYFNKSIENLQTDYLDLFLIHWPCEADGLFLETYKLWKNFSGKVR